MEDYKTGNKSLSSSELLNGVQIQLPAYSYALCKGISNSLIDNYGYSQVGLAAPEKGEALVFEPKNCDYSPDDIDTAMRYSDLVIRRSIRRIADGESRCSRGSCRPHTLRVLSICRFLRKCSFKAGESQRRE